MEKYIIEVPHGEDKGSCMRAKITRLHKFTREEIGEPDNLMEHHSG